MKVTLEQNYKNIYTINDLERAKMVISYEKDDEETAKGWAEYAVNEALKGRDDWCREVIKAEAHTAKNYRAWDAYGDETKDMDIWIDAIAETSNGFITVGAYLTDIWQTGSEDYRQHMYTRYFKEVR